MSLAPDQLTETPFRRAVPGPAALDVLSDALRVVRASGALLLRGEFTGSWAVATPDSSAIARIVCPGGARLAIMHLLAEGDCWIALPGRERVRLATGELVLFPRGDAHLLGSGDHAAVVPVSALLPPAPWTELPVLRHGGGGERARIVCCYLRCDDLLFTPFLEPLPPVLHLRADGGSTHEWVSASIRYVIAESTRGGPGSGALVGKLTELLFIEALRREMCSLPETSVGWLAALRDEYVSRALQAFHARPGRAWTVEGVAREAGLSRSALVARFQRVLAKTPMQYLTTWRLQLAANRLLATSETVAAIAHAVGYGSEVALSHAFKRVTGVSPAAWRRSHRRSGTT
ncbi:AraC family transcriptional regulator [Anaeromyxobacter sp. Fw109-5]|uniref:AraC family transcriptional regulator n=1 Tax=Anaeromyxobacter sp. (strain Fw109-5) TaxID=404589 RepID=UPI0000ED8BB7|nr:AraC family transcriptional regulator [Anaeromyxobacter sp. Fw109-5]ABS26258.1 helix-turn-helix- domain containing protein AraC type [Anaeromyxobacter sp. Fw109-5]